MVRAHSRSYLVLAGLITALIAVSSLFNLAANDSFASSHREAPEISQDPTADNTDVYAFVSPDAPDTVTLIANYYPGEDPAGGPNFYAFGDDVAYDIKIDNDHDAVEDITYRFDFFTTVNNPDVPLYNTGPIESLDSENWNIRQGYNVTKITDAGSEQLPFEGVVPPVNVGPTSTPNYRELADAAIAEVDGMKIFAGQRDDPFWVDLGGIFDLLTIRQLPGNEGGGVDALTGFNVQTIAIQVPIADLTATGQAPTGPTDDNAIIGVWSTANRFSTTVIAADGTRTGEGDLVQVSRLGMPLVNEVVVPVGVKDYFNGSQPKDDAQYLDAVLHPVLPGLLNQLYGVNVPEGDRNDLVSVFLTGVEGLNMPSNGVPSEMLRLNMAIPPAAPGTENRMGVLGGDTAGFPNGRRLGDDVVDIALQVVAGVLVGDEFNVAPNNQLGDGVDFNDRQFLDTFPYVALPYEGFEHKHHRQKPADLENPSGQSENAGVTEVSIDLDELSNSGVSGSATLTADGDQTHVVLDVEGASGGNPVHIHNGTCTNLLDVVFPLTDIDASGMSETTVDMKLSDLLDGEFAINAHLSADQINTYITCGDIVA
jgi:Domain of unknown function (DUF4331)